MDFADNKKELSELQRQAEEKDLPDQERARRQDAVWARIRKLESVADMYKSVSSEDRKLCRASIKQELANLPNGEDEQLAGHRKPSWVTYEEAESLALESITQATLKDQADRDERNPDS